MCDKDNQNSCNCLNDILNKIIHLQRNSFSDCTVGGCDKPFLGPESTLCYNTRPISFYNCSTGEIWNVNGANIFRLESLDDCCCTCRILNYENGEFSATNEFFTINLKCISAIKCYQDTYLNL